LWGISITPNYALERERFGEARRGRAGNCRARGSVPLGKYCRSKRLVFSLEPRCQGLCGSQKYTAMSVCVTSDYGEWFSDRIRPAHHEAGAYEEVA